MLTILDYGYRSKCCLAPIRVGKKKVRKTGDVVQVWVCCACKTKDVNIISTVEALQIKQKDYLKPDIDDDKDFVE